MFNSDIIRNPFNELVSPFHPVFQTTKYKPHTTRQLCNCDDDADDYGMAPECAFICKSNNVGVHKNATKKRRSTRQDAKKTRRK